MGMNPFKFGRYEHEAHPAIFLPRRYSEFASGTSYYIQGSRGTGKTAILRSLSSKDRVKPSSFQMNVQQFLNERILGLYTRVSDLQIPRFAWLADEQEIRDYLFGAYFAFMHCQLLCDALATLPAQGYLPISPAEELRFSDLFFSEFPELTGLTLPTSYRQTFSSIKQVFGQLLDQIHEIAVRPRAISSIPGLFLQPNKRVLDRFSELLLEEVSLLQDWGFILCLDEAEVFALWQQKIINTYVHGTKSPWSYLIAFVENSFELTETSTPNQPLGADDRKVRSLDDVSRKDFIEFADGVVKLRLERAGYSAKAITLQKLLGTVPVNDLLQQQLSQSTKREARNLLCEAEKYRQLFRRRDDAGKSPPIYETWLKSKDPRIGACIELFEDALDNRRISSSGIRKRHLVAYHDICAHFGFKPIYAGFDAVIALSDQCVRDLLRMLCYMFLTEQSDEWIRNCSASSCQIGVQTQNAAIREASEDKRRRMAEEVVTNQAEVELLMDNLGEMFRTHYSEEASALDPDRGFLRIRYTATEAADPFFVTISEARYCGLIHAKRTKADVQVRLHTMLSPIYDLPGRRPTYHVTTTLSEAKQFLCGKFDRRLAVRILGSRPSPQVGLFEEPEVHS